MINLLVLKKNSCLASSLESRFTGDPFSRREAVFRRKSREEIYSPFDLIPATSSRVEIDLFVELVCIPQPRGRSENDRDV